MISNMGLTHLGLAASKLVIKKRNGSHKKCSELAYSYKIVSLNLEKLQIVYFKEKNSNLNLYTVGQMVDKNISLFNYKQFWPTVQ